MIKIPEIRSVSGYNGYFITETGEVYTTKPQNGQMHQQGFIRGLMHKMLPFKNHGYMAIKFSDENGVRKHHRVHRLVADVFIPNENNYPQVNHKDGDTQNNMVDNLEWCTAQYNALHAHRVLGVGYRRSVRLTILQTNETKDFNSITECADYIGVSSSYLNNMLLGNSSFENWSMNDLYKVEYLD